MRTKNQKFKMELWKQINEFESHFISNFGRIKAIQVITNFGSQFKVYPERFLNPWLSKTGYNYVDISINGKVNRFLVHRLVAQHFIENPENKSQVNHKDGNKSNNIFENLEWCNAKQNLKHARDLGLNKSTGTDNALAKFNKSEILSIRSSLKPLKELSEMYGASISVLSRIRNLKSYKNV